MFDSTPLINYAICSAIAVISCVVSATLARARLRDRLDLELEVLVDTLQAVSFEGKVSTGPVIVNLNRIRDSL